MSDTLYKSNFYLTISHVHMKTIEFNSCWTWLVVSFSSVLNFIFQLTLRMPCIVTKNFNPCVLQLMPAIWPMRLSKCNKTANRCKYQVCVFTRV